MGALYAAVVFLGAINQNAVQPIVAVERTVFYRERAAGMYSSLPYALSQVNIRSMRFVKCLKYPLIWFFPNLWKCKYKYAN